MCEVGVIRFEESEPFLHANNLTDVEEALIRRTLIRLAEAKGIKVAQTYNRAIFQPLSGEDDAQFFENCSGMTLGSPKEQDPEELVAEGYPEQAILNGLSVAMSMRARGVLVA